MKKNFKKSSFFLNGPAISGGFFFAASLKGRKKNFLRVSLYKTLNIQYSSIFYPISSHQSIYPWKGFGRSRLSCLLHYIHYLIIPLHTNIWDDISRTIFVNSPVPHEALLVFYLSISLSSKTHFSIFLSSIDLFNPSNYLQSIYLSYLSIHSIRI